MKREMGIRVSVSLFVLIIIIVLDRLYKDTFDEWSNKIIFEWQSKIMTQLTEYYLPILQYIQYFGNGRELNIYFMYHLMITGKYHRAFTTSMLISSCFIIVSLGQILYQDPRPFWV